MDNIQRPRFGILGLPTRFGRRRRIAGTEVSLGMLRGGPCALTALRLWHCSGLGGYPHKGTQKVVPVQPW